MLTTPAIVLHLNKCNDKTSLLHLYTRECGRVVYAVYGLDGKRRKGKLSKEMVFPLSILSIEAEHNDSRPVQQLKEAEFGYVPLHLVGDVRRSTVAIFIAEVLSRTLLHPLPDEDLFDYLIATIQRLDIDEHIENLHLQFLLRFSAYLGIAPSLDGGEKYLNMETGCKTDIITNSHTEYFDEKEVKLLEQLDAEDDLQLTRSQRQTMLTKLCRYYELHLPDFVTPKSLEVLQQVMD